MTPLLTALVAFGAGIASFLSPCVLPLVPAYIGHLAGTSVSEERDTEATLRTVAHAAFFVLGFSAVFVILWASIGLVGWAIQGYTFYLRYIGGAILVILGLHVAGVFRLRWLNQERRVYVDRSRPRSYLTSWLVGITFAAGWTPCIGPILAGIIALAATRDTVGQGSLLLALYSAGLGIPFLLTAVGLSRAVPMLRWMNRHAHTVEVASGGLLIFIGVLMFMNTFAQLARYFTWIPVF